MKNTTPLKLKVLACKVISRELALVTANCRNSLDVTLVRQKLHNTPRKLREVLQQEIDSIESGNDRYTNEDIDFDAILIGYGLCSNAVVGLHSSKYKLVIPRAHDCTTFFLGSKESYMDVFLKHKGTFFYNRSWVEVLPEQGEALLARKYEEYMEQYDDEETVEFLMDMERQMIANYENAAYISWPGQDEEEYKDVIRDLADEKGWNFMELEGSPSLMQRMVDGDWNEEDFLIVKPGQTVKPTGDDRVIKAE